MKDLTIALDNRPEALAKMGEALGCAEVSIERRWSLGDQRSRCCTLPSMMELERATR